MAKATGKRTKVEKKAPESEELAVVDFALDKETKNTFRYKEVEDDDKARPDMGTIYLTKELANGHKNIRVTIESM